MITDGEVPLFDAVHAYEQVAARMAVAVEARDEAIRRALADGVPRARVVEITGLSKQRVDQIRRGARL